MNSQPPAVHFSAQGVDGPDAALFMERLSQLGTASLVVNVCADAVLEQAGGHALPVIVTSGEIGHSYVAAPHSVYVLNPRKVPRSLSAATKSRRACGNPKQG